MAKDGLSKNQRKRQRQKELKDEAKKAADTPASDRNGNDDVKTHAAEEPSADILAAVELAENFAITSEVDPLFEPLKHLFQKPEEDEDDDVERPVVSAKKDIHYDKVNTERVLFENDDDIQSEEEEEETRQVISRKKKREESRISIAALKAATTRPDLVEWTDVNSPDPILLLKIKASKNVVPVPPHWSQKREYLSSKRGIEKPAFQLPKFIADTGISEMRDSVLDKQAEQTLKQKQRERVAPKMGKLDIDYAKLYEAFFKYQTKPPLTRFGEVYYEGKEYETNLRHLKPGELSQDLRDALGMPPNAPPPWLINQQRFGPPPSYPALRIAGLNAPPPPGASWGFHAGGYGKPPLDEFNRPLFGGDIYGVAAPRTHERPHGNPIERTLWGELEEPQSDEEEEEDEEEEDDEMEEEQGGPEPAAVGREETTRRGSKSGLASVAPQEVPAHNISGEFNLRKQRDGTDTEEPQVRRSAGQVLAERNVRADGFFGSDRAYDLQGARKDLRVLGDEEANPRKRKVGDVDVSVDIDDLQRDGRLNKDNLSKQYEAGRRAEQPRGWEGVDQEDLSQMIAEESHKRQKKDEERRRRR